MIWDVWLCVCGKDKSELYLQCIKKPTHTHRRANLSIILTFHLHVYWINNSNKQCSVEIVHISNICVFFCWAVRVRISMLSSCFAKCKLSVRQNSDGDQLSWRGSTAEYALVSMTPSKGNHDLRFFFRWTAESLGPLWVEKTLLLLEWKMDHLKDTVTKLKAGFSTHQHPFHSSNNKWIKTTTKCC